MEVLNVVIAVFILIGMNDQDDRKTCKQCGTNASPDSKYCPCCGRDLDIQTAIEDLVKEAYQRSEKIYYEGIVHRLDELCVTLSTLEHDLDGLISYKGKS